MAHQSTRRWWSAFMWASVLLVISARSSLAAPILLPSVSTLEGGLFEYRYDLVNPIDEVENIFDLGLFFAGDPMAIGSPAGWDYIAGLGFIDWFSPGVDTDLVPGASLTGFSFQSAFGPGPITFQTTSADPLTGFPTSLPFTDTTIGPVLAPAPVPEPATLVLLGSGLAFAWRMRRRSGSPHS